jgi:hypothetical protein
MKFSAVAMTGAVCLALAGCDGGQPTRPAPVASTNPAASFPGPATTVSSPAALVVKRFSGIPMPPNNVLDLDRTVLVGSEAEWVGRIFFTAPMSVDDLVEFYRHEMPRYGWTELAVVRSGTSVLSFQGEARIATIQVTPLPAAGTRVEFWMNPRPAGGAQPVLQTAEPGPPATVQGPWRGVGQTYATAPAARLPVDQAPLPPWR